MKPSVQRKNGICFRGKGPGFTLVEVLVAIAILLLLAALSIAGLSAFRMGTQVRATQTMLNSAVGIGEILATKSPVLPDHRAANFYWIRPHATNPPSAMVDTAGARQMSSAEFFTFLASRVAPTDKPMHSMGDSLRPSQVPAAWGSTSSPALVDVYEQNPVVGDLLYRAKCPGYAANGTPMAGAPVFALVSDPEGHALRSLFDPWGHEIVYRFYTHKNDLNGTDATDVGTATSTSRHDAETIVQDEAAAARDGLGAVQPAVAAYGHPFFMSAGPDGKWGAFVQPTAATPARDALAPQKTTARDVDASDNLYSQEWSQ